MEQWALLRFDGNLYRLRIRRDWSEPTVVAEAVGETVRPRIAEILTKAANQDFPEYKHEYIPHLCLATAEALARRLHGEVVDSSHHQSTTEPEDGLVVY